jgi:putative colanic acid biosynthesis UDP-glucose lipid carrier transferase
VALGQEIVRNPYIATRVMGFFDDRSSERLERKGELPLLGKLDHLPEYVRKNHIDAIYLSLPMATHPRMLRLLEELSDTTASIYFVPDIFIAEVMQGRMDSVGEIPVVAVCETPFSGINRIVKRLSDIVLSVVILILISPLLLAIAVGVKMTSPGPIIFKQRRYGLNGEEIVVSKFRTMSTCEDNGDFIRQAQKNDSRVTPFGAFLRRTSLDELPQFFNVIQGRMSIVGPRPHAVAHNELYRKIIKGYMVRHKVKPGVTGWAQVNGCRGETDTVEKMKKRIDYDLAYLRNWSLLLDLYIIFKTIFVVFDDRNAY